MTNIPEKKGGSPDIGYDSSLYYPRSRFDLCVVRVNFVTRQSTIPFYYWRKFGWVRWRQNCVLIIVSSPWFMVAYSYRSVVWLLHFFRFVIGCGQKIISSLKNFGLCYSHHHFAMVGDCLGEQGWVIRFQDFSSSFSSCKKLPSVEDSWRLCRGDVVIRMWSTIFFFSGLFCFWVDVGRIRSWHALFRSTGCLLIHFFFLLNSPIDANWLGF
jgi:hypothetical protein